MKHLLALALLLAALSSCNPLNPAHYFSQRAATGYRLSDELLAQRDTIILSATWDSYPYPLPKGWSLSSGYQLYPLIELPKAQQDDIIQQLSELSREYNKEIGTKEFILWPYEVNRTYIGISINKNINIRLAQRVTMSSGEIYSTYTRAITPAEARLRDTLVTYLMARESKIQREED